MKAKSVKLAAVSRPAKARPPIKPERNTSVPENLYALVAGQKFFKGLSRHQLQLLADSAMEERFEANEIIYREGDPANRFYIILAGEAAIETETANGEAIRIQNLGPGDDMGWSWLFAPFYTHFSARALTPVTVIFFYGTRLREQCEADHDLGFELMKRIAGVMVACIQATREKLVELSRP